MAKIYSVGVDDETSALIEQDRAVLAAELGMESITPSQYLRLLLNQHLSLRGQAPTMGRDRGAWAEGFRAAYAEVMRTVGGALTELQARHAEIISGVAPPEDG